MLRIQGINRRERILLKVFTCYITELPCGNGVGLAEKLEEEAEENFNGFSSSSDEDVFSLRVKEKNLNSILENQSTEENDPERLKKEEEIMITGSAN